MQTCNPDPGASGVAWNIKKEGNAQVLVSTAALTKTAAREHGYAVPAVNVFDEKCAPLWTPHRRWRRALRCGTQEPR